MKKKFRSLDCLLVLGVVLALVGCKDSKPVADNSTPTTSTQNQNVDRVAPPEDKGKADSAKGESNETKSDKKNSEIKAQNPVNNDRVSPPVDRRETKVQPPPTRNDRAEPPTSEEVDRTPDRGAPDRNKKPDVNDEREDEGDTDENEVTLSGESGTEVGDMIPEISGKDVDGTKFALSDYSGKVLMIDFWGDW